MDKLKRKILQIHPITLQIINLFDSSMMAERETGINHGFIIRVCKSKANQAGGYIWRYFDDFFDNNYINCYSVATNNNLFNNKFICSPFWLMGYMNNYITSYFIQFLGEEFRDIEGYEGLYQVSNFGRVLSLYNKPYVYIFNSYIGDTGYYRVNLTKDKITKTYFIHRLVAEAFIPNPLKLPIINHKDEIKTNNYDSNLEWCTDKYNSNYGNSKIKNSISNSIPIQQIDIKNGKIINEFYGIKEAEKNTNIHSSCIGRVCRGERKQAGGYFWKYK